MDILLISGSMGSGKSSVVGEISDLLTERGVAHGAIDLDWLANGFFGNSATGLELEFKNLQAVCANYRAAGILKFLIAGALDRDGLSRMQKAFAGAEITVCRLRADIRMMRERVGQRETGMNQARYLARIKSLEEELDRNPSEAFSVENQNRSITEVAREILQRARWM